jgi:hypothetical protein
LTYSQALRSTERDEWIQAVESEYQSLENNGTWRLEQLPKGAKAISSKWVFKKKYKEGILERYKARLVARGFTQSPDTYSEIFSPVMRLDTLRLVLALSVQNGWPAPTQHDVETAFLYSDLDEIIYLRLPEGRKQFDQDGTELVLRLLKCIYGLKQGSRAWNRLLDKVLRQIGFRSSKADPCLYVFFDEGGTAIVLVYVDDLVLAGDHISKRHETIAFLRKHFKLKDLGILNWCLGIKITVTDNSISLSQEQYISSMLDKFQMTNCKIKTTPGEPNSRLSKKDCPDDADADIEYPYRQVVGSLLYALHTRPDIASAVREVSQFMCNPGNPHVIATKRILRYLKGTMSLELKYTRSETNELTGYADSDWANGMDDRRSITGYAFMYANAAVSFKSKKQSCVALSSAEAEYMAACEATREALFLRQLLTDLRSPVSGTTTIFEDNTGCQAMAKNPVNHSRRKHIDVKFHFIQDEVEKGTVSLEDINTEDQVADVLTKNLAAPKLTKFRKILMGED